jgi:hypothetical protein
MIADINALFEELEDEFLEDERVDSPLHPRRDIAAMLLLHKIKSGTVPILAHASHDVIFFDLSLDDLAENASREQVLELISNVASSRLLPEVTVELNPKG